MESIDLQDPKWLVWTNPLHGNNHSGGVIISDTNDNMDGNSKAIVHQGSFVDTGDKLIQAYDNGFFLIIDKVSGTIKINGRNGLPHTVFDNAAVKQIAVLQELAKTLK